MSVPTTNNSNVVTVTEAGQIVVVSDVLKGDSGSLWLTGTGPPIASLGADSDLYLDSVTADVWQKTAGIWNFVINIRGIQGLPGGPVPQINTVVPVAATGPADSLALTDYLGVTWMVRISDGSGTTSRTIIATHDSGSVAHTVTGGASTGTPVSYSLDVQVVGLDLVLEVTNTGILPLTVRALRLSIAV